MQFRFVTYALVLVLDNALLLGLLALLFPARFAVDSLMWALVGGIDLGLLSSFLESLLGLTMPLVPDEPVELRRQVEEQARHADWLAVASGEAVPEEQALAIETAAMEAKASGPAAAEPDAAQRDVAEPSTSGPDEGPSPPAEVDAEPVGSVVMPPAEAGVSEDPEPAPEPREEEEEERS